MYENEQKMAYTQNAAGASQAINQVARRAGTDAPEGPIETAVWRVHEIAGRLEDTAARLRDHADLVFGGLPESEGRVGPAQVRAGLIGGLHDALDRLERVQSYVTEQTQRNCTLA